MYYYETKVNIFRQRKANDSALSIRKKIKEIMTITGIKSEQTIYRLLDENNIPRRPKIESKKVSFTATKEVLSILQDKEDISMFINNAIMAFNIFK